MVTLTRKLMSMSSNDRIHRDPEWILYPMAPMAIVISCRTVWPRCYLIQIFVANILNVRWLIRIKMALLFTGGIPSRTRRTVRKQRWPFMDAVYYHSVSQRNRRSGFSYWQSTFPGQGSQTETEKIPGCCKETESRYQYFFSLGLGVLCEKYHRGPGAAKRVVKKTMEDYIRWKKEHVL